MDNMPGKYDSAWTSHDDAEYNRLSTEMNEDSKLQFTLFTFGVTASTAVLGFLTSTAANTSSSLLSGYFFLAFLTPLIILLPTSAVILNRARTRNRKAAYIIVCYDYKRLYAAGFGDLNLQSVREYPFLPWETALHILDRVNYDKGRQAHIAPALKYMRVGHKS